jgi:hypothetical protein
LICVMASRYGIYKTPIPRRSNSFAIAIVRCVFPEPGCPKSATELFLSDLID